MLFIYLSSIVDRSSKKFIIVGGFYILYIKGIMIMCNVVVYSFVGIDVVVVH